MYLLAGICSDPSFLSGTIATMAATSLALMAVLLALFYMAAQLFKKQEYEAFVSIEMHQLLVSVLIFLFVFGAACTASQIADSFAGGDQFTIARDYLHYISNEVALPTLVSLEKMKIYMQWFGSLSMRWGLTVWGAVLPAFPSFILLERVLEFVLMLLAPFVSSLTVQEIGLEIIQATMLPYVLPAGVVLRIFPPTRDAGSFLIVTAIAFQIVFPYTYVMHSEIVSLMMAEDTNDPYYELSQDYPSLLTYVDDQQSGGAMSLGSSSISEFYTNIMSLPYQLLHSIDNIAYIVFQAVFLPALSITLTIAFIKGTLKFVSQKLD